MADFLHHINKRIVFFMSYNEVKFCLYGFIFYEYKVNKPHIFEKDQILHFNGAIKKANAVDIFRIEKNKIVYVVV